MDSFLKKQQNPEHKNNGNKPADMHTTSKKEEEPNSPKHADKNGRIKGESNDFKELIDNGKFSFEKIVIGSRKKKMEI